MLCAGGRGNLDDVAAAILAQLLERCGVGARVASFQAIETGTYGSLDLEGVQVVCLSYMNPASSLMHATRFGGSGAGQAVPIVVGFWSPHPDESGRS